MPGVTGSRAWSSVPRAGDARAVDSCVIAGSATFREREVGGAWLTRTIGRGHIFVTRSRTPYEVSHTSPAEEELEIVQCESK